LVILLMNERFGNENDVIFNEHYTYNQRNRKRNANGAVSFASKELFPFLLCLDLMDLIHYLLVLNLHLWWFSSGIFLNSHFDLASSESCLSTFFFVCGDENMWWPYDLMWGYWLQFQWNWGDFQLDQPNLWGVGSMICYHQKEGSMIMIGKSLMLSGFCSCMLEFQIFLFFLFLVNSIDAGCVWYKIRFVSSFGCKVETFSTDWNSFLICWIDSFRGNIACSRFTLSWNLEVLPLWIITSFYNEFSTI